LTLIPTASTIFQVGRSQQHDPVLAGDSPEPSRSRVLLPLALILLAAALLRLIHLGQNPYVLDELWALEIATGHGAVHQQSRFVFVLTRDSNSPQLPGTQLLGERAYIGLGYVWTFQADDLSRQPAQ
jgi:hypothetical protein